MNTIISIYVPLLEASITEEYIKSIFNTFGEVHSVDFITPKNKTKGFKDVGGGREMFIYFTKIYHYNGYKVCYPGCDEETTLWMDILEGKSHRLRVYPFCNCFPNKTPVERSMMNTHQIVENCRYLESVVETQGNTIVEMNDKIDRCTQAIYQLLGGLYNQETQSGMLEQCIHSILPEFKIGADLVGSKWPTTRQGDKNEKRIESLERLLNVEEEDEEEEEDDEEDKDEENEEEEEEEENASVSTHSSMPSLHDVIPEFMEQPDLLYSSVIDYFNTFNAFEDE